ncbi:helix-turn-helix transcriptional regulator [Streptomyces mesophilus]|uniref:helix-turn-helix transcriptional regulator n=1 Tax=Streptomyces mesophilus TaxID=1775132 RepID=UPI003316A6AC
MRERALEKIARMSRQPGDLVTFWQEATEVITATVPFYSVPCWYTLDPASLLITSHYHPGMTAFPADWLAQEYYGDDVNQLADVVLSDSGISTLHEATDGDPSHSPRWQRNIALGGDQELIAGLRSKAGDVWGALGLYREPGQPMFDERDKSFLRALAPHLAEGARRALLVGEAADPDGPDAPGLLILTADWDIESATPGVERWLRDLPDGDFDAGRLPSVVPALAGRAMRTGAQPGRPGEVAVARVLSNSGTWLVLHGTSLVSAGPPRVAIIIEPGRPARIHSLLMSAYNLTAREREVTRHVLQGSSTTQIAEDLVISVHTVRQHLKSIFGKADVRSRRDLVAKVFYGHYEPRLRDNERRTVDGKPVRGGPKA